MTDAPAVWRESFPVYAHQVLPRGTASVLTLSNIFQEAAGHHADALGVAMEDLMAAGRAWVMARFKIAVERLPRAGDAVAVATWPSGLDGAYATREFILRTPTGDRLAAGSSAWLVIDTEQRRPVRPPAALHALTPPDREPPVAPSFASLNVPSAPPHRRAFRVRYHDLDLNDHVNNVRYAEWAVETLPVAHLRGHRCTALELHFKAEAVAGDAVEGHAAPAESQAFTHAIVRPSDGQTLALARTAWRPLA
ncbi:acyl-[acyl-carrier-protein] thioesterase [Salisaeta longa]|uniref:acyl-[acyl-carrier-protein] thioesterase n=1 Tax=Salisaeta longa TaxID=503170 RepID=UPI0003B4EE4E|nr:acyl-ACP thioesterase domain-containing protein [Salisaeta longa]